MSKTATTTLYQTHLESHLVLSIITQQFKRSIRGHIIYALFFLFAGLVTIPSGAILIIMQNSIVAMGLGCVLAFIGGLSVYCLTKEYSSLKTEKGDLNSWLTCMIIRE